VVVKVTSHAIAESLRDRAVEVTREPDLVHEVTVVDTVHDLAADLPRVIRDLGHIAVMVPDEDGHHLSLDPREEVDPDRVLDPTLVTEAGGEINLDHNFATEAESVRDPSRLSNMTRSPMSVNQWARSGLVLVRCLPHLSENDSVLKTRRLVC
jgi:hypothetical protein